MRVASFSYYDSINLVNTIQENKYCFLIILIDLIARPSAYINAEANSNNLLKRLQKRETMRLVPPSIIYLLLIFICAISSFSKTTNASLRAVAGQNLLPCIRLQLPVCKQLLY